jgi:DNA segregation ATPase FtsK/SpoIIIE, S-DNA-T family
VLKNSPIELVTALPERTPPGRIAIEFTALVVWALTAYAGLSLLCAEGGWSPNLGGPVGTLLAGWLGRLLGLPAYFALALTALLGHHVWGQQGQSLHGAGLRWTRVGAGGMIVLAGICAAVALGDPSGTRGGVLGAVLAEQLRANLNLGGGAIVVVLALVGGTTLLVGRAPTELAVAFSRLFRRREASVEASPGVADNPSFEALATPSPLVDRLEIPTLPIDGRATLSNAKSGAGSLAWPSTNNNYKVPPLTLLDVPPLEHDQADETQLERSARILEAKLADFGVEGKVVQVQPGPVVSMYKLEPGSGIKVSQIVNLADDLSMALRAATIRIQAPVPGEAVVGIEVPNRQREKIFLREILEGEQSAASSGRLMIALGKDIAGRPMTADLALMPHLLIAGATGSGKSVSIHTMIASILFNATPDDVRFILIDPKMLELSVYEAIPHLLVPVVVDPEKAAAALLWATREMENRYRLMRDLGVRNVDGYNRMLGEQGELIQLRGVTGTVTGDLTDGETTIQHRRLPKIVIVIDELADLLLSEGKTVERDITRLAQKARAAGIHLILATQRPSVDVLTGLIKANLPARISLQVASRVDSRTILDAIGAERLLGAGDMLFMPPGTGRLRRLHGPFVSENEIHKVCDYIRAQGTPDYQMEILETAAASDNESDGGERDPLYDDAVRIVTESGQASISMIQRRLRIGYNRAARMVEEMERDGLVLPADGARPRELRIRAS